MNATNRYLDRLAGMHGGCSDYRLAQLLGATKQGVSQWRSEVTQMDDRYCMRLAELIRVDPLQVIAEIRAERETDPATVKLWRRMATMAEKYGHAAALALAILATTGMATFSPTPLASAPYSDARETAPTMYIMSSHAGAPSGPRTPLDWVLLLIPLSLTAFYRSRPVA